MYTIFIGIGIFTVTLLLARLGGDRRKRISFPEFPGWGRSVLPVTMDLTEPAILFNVIPVILSPTKSPVVLFLLMMI